MFEDEKSETATKGIQMCVIVVQDRVNRKTVLLPKIHLFKLAETT